VMDTASNLAMGSADLRVVGGGNGTNQIGAVSPVSLFGIVREGVQKDQRDLPFFLAYETRVLDIYFATSQARKLSAAEEWAWAKCVLEWPGASADDVDLPLQDPLS